MKESIRKFICLSGKLTALIAIPSFLLEIMVFAVGLEGKPIAYLSYLLSFYALVICISFLVRSKSTIAAWAKRWRIWEWIRRSELGRMLLGDVIFRAKLALYLSFTINVVYVVIKFLMGVWYRSVWLLTLSFYYLLLVILRYSVIQHTRRYEIGDEMESEFRRCRFCGIVLMFMNVVLFGVVMLSVRRNQSFDYPGVLIYVMAIYAFYAVGTAVPNLISSRKQGSPLFSALMVISLTAALVAMLSLEIAMLARFGSADDVEFRPMMTFLTGGIICLIVTGLSIYMIIHATREIKRLGEAAAENIVEEERREA